MGAALVALGEALVDAVAVGLVGDDENAGFGRGSSRGGKGCAGKESRNESHEAPRDEGTAFIGYTQRIKND